MMERIRGSAEGHENIGSELDRTLEKIPGIIDPERVEIVLAIAGLKRAIEIDVVNHTSPQELKRDVLEATTILEKLGLATLPTTFLRGERRSGTTRLITGKDLEDVRTLAELLQADVDDIVRARAFGTLSGFPATAIDAYVRTKAEGYAANLENPYLMSRKEKLKLIDSETKAFANFRFSKQNAQIEGETARQWAAIVKKEAPKLYRRFMEADSHSID